MARVIDTTNGKGGVGKTTCTITIAEYLALSGYRVCIYDLEGQHSTSSFYGIIPHGGETIFEVLTEGLPIEQATYELWPGFDLVVANERMYDLQFTDEGAAALKNVLKSVSREYDFILLDTPPALGPATICALAAADELIVVTQPTALSVSAMGTFLRKLDAQREKNNTRIKVHGIMLNMMNRRRASERKMEESIRGAKWGFPVLESTIRDSADVVDATAKRRSVFRRIGRNGVPVMATTLSPVAEDFKAVIEEALL